MTYRLQSRYGRAVTGMNRKKILLTVIFIAAILTGGIAARYFLWNSGAFLPDWIEWKEETFYDLSGSYRILLRNKSLKVFSREEEVWCSEKGVKVQKALSCDIDKDGEDELLLLCWKRGRYGKHRPFWVEKDETEWSQHIFVYEYNGGEIRPKWMSSYIGQDVTKMEESQTADGQIHLLLTAPDGMVSSFIWDFWGFTKEDTDISFVAFGDNLIHEQIYRYGLSHGESFDFLFENVKEFIAASDVSIINQETPFTANSDEYSGYPRFVTPLAVGEAITGAGFTIATCATNHALDSGITGINTTKEFFDSHQIKCPGIQSEHEKEYRPYEILEKKGVRIGLLNYTYGTNGISLPAENPYMVHLLEDKEKVRNDIAQAKAETDFVIVFAHWGTEYSERPDSFQEEWTQVFLESRADVVIGTHPHALQPCEMLEDEEGHKMLVFYSLGNFISAQSEKSCIKGGMASFTISLTSQGYEVTEYALQPLSITWQEGRFMVDVAGSEP